MGASSAHHTMCAPISERQVCCLVLFPLSAPVGSDDLLSHPSLAAPTLLHLQLRLLLPLTFRLVLLQLHSILFLQLILIFCFLLFHLCTMLLALQACRKRLDHSLSLPAENWICFIEANPHVHCVHTAVHVQLCHRSVSNISNVRILFIQHHNVSGSDNLLH